MSKPVTQKAVDPSSFGGNLENAQHRVQSSKSTEKRPLVHPGPSNERDKASSNIPVARSRIPLRRMNVQPKRRGTKDTTSTARQRNTSKSLQKVEVRVDSSSGAGKEREMAGSVKENKTGPAGGGGEGGGEGRRSEKTSRVKKVPDFNKLHNKWQHKMEKAKRENRPETEVREFCLTPSRKLTRTAPHVQPSVNHGEIPVSVDKSEEDDISPFKADHAALQAILHGNGEIPSISHRSTLACGPRVIPGELRVPHTMQRYSFYGKKRAGAVSMVTETSAASPSTFSSVKNSQCRHLLQRLATTTLNSIRTASRITKCTTDDMSGVKMNLDDQLSEAEGEEGGGGAVKLPCKFDSSMISGSGVPRSATLPRQQVMMNSELSRDQFYILEPELCDILRVGVATRCIGGRGQCHSPAAQLLDNVYFIPVENN